jgi:ribonuclease HI
MKYKVYTDGSCVTSSKLGGYGVVVLDEKETIVFVEHEAYSNTTNNRMELRAFLVALEYVTSHCQEGDEIECFTDSAYISNCFAQNWYKTWQANGWRTSNRLKVKNVDLWKPIIKNFNQTKVQSIIFNIEKVKSHSGIKWNEYVDDIANSWRGLDDEKDFIVDQD